MSSTQTACAILCGAVLFACIALDISGKKCLGGERGISKTVEETTSNTDAIMIALSICFLKMGFFLE